MNKKRKIYDPIFGLIEFNEIESQIVDTPLFQRLRFIKQLGLTHYVYPTANHNRFSHSIGVFYIADQIINSLQDSNNELFTSDQIKNLKMAALLHDIGHFPFSHVFEFKKNDYSQEDLNELPFVFQHSHEDVGSYLVSKSYLNEILTNNGYDVELICNLIQGKDVSNLILNKIINWELDADRLDYILRDSYFTGVGFGHVNYEYLIENFKSYGNNLIVINSKAVRDIEHFIVARFSLYDRVYTHKTISFFNYFLKRVAYKLIIDDIYPNLSTKAAVEETIKSEESSRKLHQLTDFVFMNTAFEKYKQLKGRTEKKNITLRRELEIVLFRKKYFEILKESVFTKKPQAYIDYLKDKISSLLQPIQEKYPNQIYLDAPKNRFTGYLPPNVPDSKVRDENYDKYLEEEEQTLWIQSKEEKPEIFYRSRETFLEKIHEFGITKFLIYLRKGNSQLREDFEKYEPKIEKILQEEE